MDLRHTSIAVGAALCCEEALTANTSLPGIRASSQRKAAPTGTYAATWYPGTWIHSHSQKPRAFRQSLSTIVSFFRAPWPVAGTPNADR
ncbi:hypothetical protein CR511_15530 [Pseudomonas putida]|nr:hypothetical protein CR511_15530 [Pseudomonas putida]